MSTDSTENTDERGLISRRGIILTGASVTSLGAIGLFSASQPALAAEGSVIEAEDATLTSHDGSIAELIVEPTLDVEWEGFNSAETDAEMEITFSTDGEDDIAIERSETLSGYTGSDEFDFDDDGDDIDLLETWSEETFESEVDADETETTVTVTFGISTEDASATDTTEFDVVVKNQPADVDIGGTVETTATSDNEVEDE